LRDAFLTAKYRRRGCGFASNPRKRFTIFFRVFRVFRGLFFDSQIADTNVAPGVIDKNYPQMKQISADFPIQVCGAKPAHFFPDHHQDWSSVQKCCREMQKFRGTSLAFEMCRNQCRCGVRGMRSKMR
jgi:hypothetical protein